MLTTILPALLLSTVGNAASIHRRDDVWKAPKEGNVRIRFGDGKVNIGACHAKDIIDTLNQHCKDGAGLCEPSWTIECASEGDPWKIEVTPTESQHDPKLKKGLIDALQAAIGTDKVEESREVIGAKGGGCTGCPFTPTKSTFYKLPSFISITYKDDWSATGVPDAIAFTVANPGDDGGKGFCEAAMNIGEAMAGAVSGAAGGAFSLGSLACDLI